MHTHSLLSCLQPCLISRLPASPPLPTCPPVPGARDVRLLGRSCHEQDQHGAAAARPDALYRAGRRAPAESPGCRQRMRVRSWWQGRQGRQGTVAHLRACNSERTQLASSLRSLRPPPAPPPFLQLPIDESLGNAQAFHYTQVGCVPFLRPGLMVEVGHVAAPLSCWLPTAPDLPPFPPSPRTRSAPFGRR